MSTPIEVPVSAADVAAGLVEVVADALFQAGASAVAEHPGPDDAVVLVADPDPALLAASGLDWRPHDPSPALGQPDVGALPLTRSGRDLVVDATGAFGSGSHPTTRLCLGLVEDLIEPGMAVLDVGSGSGVLGVAAAVLGARSVVALDIDPAARDATARTAVLNDVADLVEVVDVPLAELAAGDASDRYREFDLVLANLLIPIVEELGAELAARTRPGGSLVVSGVLHDQLDRAVAACAPLELVRTDIDGDWVAAVLVRPGAPAPTAPEHAN